MNGWAFPEVSKQTGQPREVNPNFRKFLPGSFLSIQPCSQNLLTESWGESILTERLTGGTVEAMYPWAQGPEEMCFSFEHQIPSKIYEKWVILIALQFRYTFYRPQTKRLRARKIGFVFYSALRATCRAPARIWLAVIDFQNGEHGISCTW